MGALGLVFLLLWIRFSFPRLREDQLQKFAWKFLIPVSLLLILATGAMDRALPFPGWTLPGVFTLGGAQIALKAQGVALGRRIVLLGSGPLLTLVAVQLLEAGARIAAVRAVVQRVTSASVSCRTCWG